MTNPIPRLTLIIALLLGWSWDYLFYGQSLGLSFPLFVGLLLATLVGLGYVSHSPPRRQTAWLIGPLLFVAVMVFIRANAFVTFLNVTTSLILLGLLAHFYAAGRLERLGLIGYPLSLLRLGGNALTQPAPLLEASVDLDTLRQHGRQGALPVLRGVLLALPVLFIFTTFLASADAVFAQYVDDLIHLEFLADLLEWLWRGTIILVIAWLLAGGLSYALKRRGLAEFNGFERAFNKAFAVTWLGFIEVTTLLLLVDLLFLGFVAIQFTYLFGGQTNIAVEGFTYAEYARRGFFELLAVSMLTMGLILALSRWTRRQSPRQSALFNGLSSLMVGLVIIILISAFQRLRLYEAAFGYTELRLYSHLFMIWLAVAFVWFLVTLWWQPTRFAIGAFGVVLGFVISLNLINPDAFIVVQNVAHYQMQEATSATPSSSYRGSAEVDITYLMTLSDDALPLLVANLDQFSQADRQQVREHFDDRLERLESERASQRWPAFHLARYQAHRILTTDVTQVPD